jgi:beta-glucuronidase
LSALIKHTALAAAALSLALASAPVAAQAPSNQPLIAEGPGGRIALRSWALRLDPTDRGLARRWQAGGFGGSPVSVPNVVNPDQFKGAAGTRNYEGAIAWYRASFQASAAATYALAFASANFRADVFVDGRAIGVHIGSYLPFEARAALAPGRHTVVVRIDWRNPGTQSLLGFHRTWFNWGGLNGEVSVREIGESELLYPTLQTTLAPGQPSAANQPGSTQATVRVGVQVRNHGPARAIAPEGALTREGQTIALHFPARILAHGQTASFTTTAAVENPALWSAGSPALYGLSLGVAQECSISARVGLRELRWRSGRVYLNGQRLLLHGASLQEDAYGHGDALTGADQDALVRELRAIKANAVRAQHPLDPGLLERLDQAGILVWQGIGPVEGAGNWFSTTPPLLRAAERQARTAVLAAQLHPSIVTWNLVDEVAENGRNAAEVSYVQTLTRWLHAEDPARMVAVDIWGDHPPSRAGALYREVDAVAETDYTGWYDAPRATAAEQVAMMRARLSAMRRTFAGKVLVISEFGGEANTLNPSGQPGSYSFQASLLARHIAVYAADSHLSGMLIWNLRDYPLTPTFEGGSIHTKLPTLRLIEGLNQKGLFTYEGSPKPAVSTIARVFASLPRG